jgi:putative ABC transport system permease protein
MNEIRYALRSLARSPGFAAIAAITLALGIGANTSLFSLANAILARPLPELRNAESLAWVGAARRQWNMSYLEYRDLAERNTAFEGVAAFGNAPMSLSSPGAPTKIRGALVSGNFFTVLGVRMAKGRGFLPDEDATPLTHPVAVISHALWQERFEGRDDIVGQPIKLNGLAYTVVGVAPPRFNGVEHSELRSVWVPLAMTANALPGLPGLIKSRWSSWLDAVGRLKPNVDVAEANASLMALSRQLVSRDSVTYERFAARAAALNGGITPSDRDIYPVAIIAGAVTFIVLLIACANVSNMLLARATARRREIAVRLSLGGARWRVVRQLLIESLALATIATGLGVLIAAWTTGVIETTIPVPLDLSPDLRVLGFTIAAVVVTTLLFGLVPALHATRGEIVAALRDVAAGTDRHRRRLQRVLVTVQVTLSILLLVTSGMFLRSLYKATRVDVHFEATDRVLAASFDLGLQGYDAARADAFLTTLATGLSGQPGVEGITFTNQVPMGERLIGGEYTLEGETDESRSDFRERQNRGVYQSAIRPGYFDVLGIPLAQGRDFAASDAAGSERVAIVSEALARSAWPNESAIGKRISVDGNEGPYRTIVGVAREALTMGISERRRPTVYVPTRQSPNTFDFTLLIRSTQDARPLAPVVRATIAQLDADLPVDGVQSLAQYRYDRTAETRLGSQLIAIFGALSLLLAAVGVYAVLAFSVSNRTKEIGIRIAVGAGRRQIRALVMREGIALTTTGVVVGLALGMAVAKALSSLFLGVEAMDFVVFAGVALLLLATATLATLLPARRASSVEPVEALRAE